MTKNFCCYKPDDFTGDDPDACACPYHNMHERLRALFAGEDGRLWCGLHAPQKRTPARPGLETWPQRDLANIVLHHFKTRNYEVVDLRSINWLERFDCSWIRQYFTSRTPKIDLSGSRFYSETDFEGNFETIIFDRCCSNNEMRLPGRYQFLSFEDFKGDGHLIFDRASPRMVVRNSTLSGDFIIQTVGDSANVEIDGLIANSIRINMESTGISSQIKARGLITKLNVKISSSAPFGNSTAIIELDQSRVGDSLELKGMFESLKLTNIVAGTVNGKVTVKRSCDFRGLISNGRAKFIGSQFQGQTDFSDVQFLDEADFRNTTFEGKTSFRRSSFENTATFRNAGFLHHLDFSCATFNGVTTFSPGESSNHKVSDELRTKARNTFQEVNFTSTRFRNIIKFSNRRFDGAFICKNTWFSVAPNFHGCEFHQDTSFQGAQFFDVTSDGATEAYRTLKLAMESARAKDEEARFYALEQRSWRHHAKNSLALLAVSYLYDLGSEYGRSIGKPLGWTAAFAAAFSLVYWGALNWDFGRVADFCVSQSATVPGLPSMEIAIRHMLTQIVRPFEALTLRAGSYGSGGSGVCVIPGWLASISTVQTLLHLGSIALVFLAIRRRFKMD